MKNVSLCSVAPWPLVYCSFYLLRKQDRPSPQKNKCMFGYFFLFFFLKIKSFAFLGIFIFSTRSAVRDKCRNPHWYDMIMDFQLHLAAIFSSKRHRLATSLQFCSHLQINNEAAVTVWIWRRWLFPQLDIYLFIYFLFNYVMSSYPVYLTLFLSNISMYTVFQVVHWCASPVFSYFCTKCCVFYHKSKVRSHWTMQSCSKIQRGKMDTSQLQRSPHLLT